MLSISLSALWGVVIVLHPFLHVVLDVLYIRDFVYLCTMVGGGFWLVGSWHQYSALGNASDQPHEWAKRSWRHCFAQRLLQQRKSNHRLQQALDQVYNKAVLRRQCQQTAISCKTSLAWCRNHRISHSEGSNQSSSSSGPVKWDPTHNLYDYSRSQRPM